MAARACNLRSRRAAETQVYVSGLSRTGESGASIGVQVHGLQTDQRHLFAACGLLANAWRSPAAGRIPPGHDRYEGACGTAPAIMSGVCADPYCGADHTRAYTSRQSKGRPAGLGRAWPASYPGSCCHPVLGSACGLSQMRMSLLTGANGDAGPVPVTSMVYAPGATRRSATSTRHPPRRAPLRSHRLGTRVAALDTEPQLSRPQKPESCASRPASATTTSPSTSPASSALSITPISPWSPPPSPARTADHDNPATIATTRALAESERASWCPWRCAISMPCTLLT